MTKSSLIKTALAALTVSVSGCVLIDSPEEYPYTGPLVIIEFDTGSPPDDPEPDADPPPDLPPPALPELIFTEVLIDTSESGFGFGDRGEYIEVKNVGEGPATPQQIVVLMTDPTSPNPMATTQRIQTGSIGVSDAERKALAALKPIQPGGYFTLVRFETSTAPISDVVAPGSSYDFGAFANGPTLPDAGPRQLTLTYADQRTPEPFDVIRWENNRLVAPDGTNEGPAVTTDVAIGLDAEAETAADNDDPKQWCLVGAAIAEGPVFGTPGYASDCSD